MVEAETRGMDCHDGDGGGGKGSCLGNNGRAKQTGLTDGLDGKYERKRSGTWHRAALIALHFVHALPLHSPSPFLFSSHWQPSPCICCMSPCASVTEG